MKLRKDLYFNMKFENTKVYGFYSALKGMRNPKESYNKSDTSYGIGFLDSVEKDKNKKILYKNTSFAEYISIGPNDMKLAQSLIKAGSEHRKFMRQIMVSVDITAPLYWWKEFDTYKVGTVANSTSTMHKIASKPITMECFEIDDYKEYCTFLPDFLGEEGFTADNCESMIISFIDFLEGLRQKYLETKDKRFWKELIRWLPESWLQTRTVTMTYENLFAMCSCGQRRSHKLNEWSGIDDNTLENFISWARTLPYAQEFIFIDEIFTKDTTYKYEEIIETINSLGQTNTISIEDFKNALEKIKKL